MASMHENYSEANKILAQSELGVRIVRIRSLSRLNESACHSRKRGPCVRRCNRKVRKDYFLGSLQTSVGARNE